LFKNNINALPFLDFCKASHIEQMHAELRFVEEEASFGDLEGLELFIANSCLLIGCYSLAKISCWLCSMLRGYIVLLIGGG